MIESLASDETAVGDAAGNRDYIALRSACERLRSDAEAAQAFPQIPEVSVQASWARALAQLARAAGDCIAGVSQTPVSAPLITAAGDELDDGTNQIIDATDQLDRLLNAASYSVDVPRGRS